MRIVLIIVVVVYPLRRAGRIAGLPMKSLLGQKLGMSQVFSKTGEVLPVTLILAKPNAITARRTEGKDRYEAVQLAIPKREVKDGEKRTPRALSRMFAVRREFKTAVAEDIATLGVDQFAAGDVVAVSGISKGKGFQGVVKRHGFKGGPASHGHRHWERRGGSIGSRFPQHVRKGKKMPGRMGAERVTVKNLEVVSVDAKKNLLVLKGAVPGPRGSVVEVREVTKEDNG